MLIRFFDKHYSKFILFGMVGTLWFAALCHAAHDIWAATVLFSATTLFSLVFCLGRLRDKQPIKAPLWISVLIFIFAIGLSCWHSYDLETTWLEFWGWAFGFLYFYLFVNVIEDSGEAERFYALAGGVVIPLALICIWQQLTKQPEGYGVLELPISWIKPGLARSIQYGHWEIKATLNNSIVMAGFILYWPLFYWKKTLEDRRYGLALLACLVALVLARSWWAFAILLLGIVISYPRQASELFSRHAKAAVPALFLFLLFLTFSLYWKTHHRPLGVSYTASYHAGNRWYYWLSTLHMWQHHLWTGVGLGGFATAYPYFKIGRIENTRLVHSFPLQLLAETGLAGALAFLGILVDFLRLRLKRDPTIGRTPPGSVFDRTLILVLLFSLITVSMDFLLNKITLLLLIGSILSSTSLPSFRIKPIWLASTGCVLFLLSSFWLNLFGASRLYASGLIYESRGDSAKAERAYLDAVALEPFHADSYWRLSQIHEAQFNKYRSPQELAAAASYLQQAVRCKKSVAFLVDMERLEKLEHMPAKITPLPSK